MDWIGWDKTKWDGIERVCARVAVWVQLGLGLACGRMNVGDISAFIEIVINRVAGRPGRAH